MGLDKLEKEEGEEVDEEFEDLEDDDRSIHSKRFLLYRNSFLEKRKICIPKMTCVHLN